MANVKALQAFLELPNNYRIYNNLYDQCVALANAYWTGVLELPLPVGIDSAIHWWEKRGQPNLTNHATFSDRPVAGALFISIGGIYNRTHGHIGLVTSVNPDGTFNTMEQNAENYRYTGRYRRNLRDMVGFIVPKVNPFDTTNKRKGIPMYDLYWTGPTTKNTSVSGRMISALGSFWVPNMQVYNLLLRRRNALLNSGAATSDNMLDAEHDILNAFLRSTVQSAVSGIALDGTKYLSALNDAIKALGKDLVITPDTVNIDADLLAKAFDIAVPRIVAAIIKESGKKLSS